MNYDKHRSLLRKCKKIVCCVKAFINIGQLRETPRKKTTCAELLLLQSAIWLTHYFGTPSFFFCSFFCTSAVVALSPYLSLPVVLFRDGVTQDVQETDVSRWGRRVSEHLQSNRRRGREGRGQRV